MTSLRSNDYKTFDWDSHITSAAKTRTFICSVQPPFPDVMHHLCKCIAENCIKYYYHAQVSANCQFDIVDKLQTQEFRAGVPAVAASFQLLAQYLDLACQVLTIPIKPP